MLYVESDNTAALALYQRLGFRHVSTDVMYERHHTELASNTGR
jgi:ribosomal protein S18 acetylase RimI-like enzyme